MRLRQLTSQIENLTLKDTSSRLATYLIYLTEKQKNKWKINLDIPKKDLACVLGIAPEILSRILNKMSEKHLIKINKSNIQLLDYDSVVKIGKFGKFKISN